MGVRHCKRAEATARAFNKCCIRILNPYPEVQLDDTWNGAERSLVLEFFERKKGAGHPYIFLSIFGRDYSGR